MLILKDLNYTSAMSFFVVFPRWEISSERQLKLASILGQRWAEFQEVVECLPVVLLTL